MQIGVENFLGISEVYVVFEDTDSIWWLKFLKKGFRHCYVLLTSRENNLMILLLLHHISYIKKLKIVGKKS